MKLADAGLMVPSIVMDTTFWAWISSGKKQIAMIKGSFLTLVRYKIVCRYVSMQVCGVGYPAAGA
jgi:hypothetical protein